MALGKVESCPPRRLGLPSRGAELDSSASPRLRGDLGLRGCTPPRPGGEDVGTGYGCVIMGIMGGAIMGLLGCDYGAVRLVRRKCRAGVSRLFWGGWRVEIVLLSGIYCMGYLG